MASPTVLEKGQSDIQFGYIYGQYKKHDYVYLFNDEEVNYFFTEILPFIYSGLFYSWNTGLGNGHEIGLRVNGSQTFELNWKHRYYKSIHDFNISGNLNLQTIANFRRLPSLQYDFIIGYDKLYLTAGYFAERDYLSYKSNYSYQLRNHIGVGFELKPLRYQINYIPDKHAFMIGMMYRFYK